MAEKDKTKAPRGPGRTRPERIGRMLLWTLAGLILLVLAGAIVFRLFGNRLIEFATRPTGPFAASPQAPAPDYAAMAGWVARPGKPGDPSRFAPEGFRAAPRPAVRVFYVTPSVYVGRDRWNAPLGEAETDERLASFTAAQGSVFNGVGAVWSPAYRQAATGAFTGGPSPDAVLAIDFAYRDVARAWAAFLKANPDGPIILAGHSQGSLHLARLLATAVRGRPEAERILAAYLIGWPLSVEADLPALGLTPCTAADQTGCIISYQSFAEPAAPQALSAAFLAIPSFTGRLKAGTRMLCVNPVRGMMTEAPAVANANLGSLRPNSEAPAKPTIVPRLVGARCERGVLVIGPPPEGFDRYVLPGNNFHVYDYHLFWANLRADAERRVDAWLAANPPAQAAE